MVTGSAGGCLNNDLPAELLPQKIFMGIADAGKIEPLHLSVAVSHKQPAGFVLCNSADVDKMDHFVMDQRLPDLNAVVVYECEGVKQ